MPNWCDNYLELSGPSDQIEALVEAIPSGMFDHVMPLSESDSILTAADKWGTKWDVTDAEVGDITYTDDGMAEVKMSFMTAWAPPIGVYEALCDRGVQVLGYYYEPGVAFCGIFEDEQVHEYPIDIDNKDFFEIDGHGVHLDEMFGIVDDLKLHNEEYNDEW